MIYLNKDDYYEVFLSSRLTEESIKILYQLYQPIVGHDAIALYLTLYYEFEKQNLIFASTHESLIELMNLNISKIQEERKILEGIGLIESYYYKDENKTNYRYVLLPPKSADDFFNDILLTGLLVRSIGAKKTNQIANLYKLKKFEKESFIDVTESFVNAFHPNLDSSSFSAKIDYQNSYLKNRKNIDNGFDTGSFLENVEKNYQIKNDFFNKNDLEQIAKISLLYGIEEEVMATIVAQSLINKKIDFEMVKKLAINDKDFSPIRNAKVIRSNDLIDGNSLLSKKINLMSTTAPFDYLKIKQNNGAVSPSDIRLIDDLNNKYGLNPKVINTLVDYVLENYENTLPRNLVLKIAGSLKRENIESCIDAMNYLYKIKKLSKNHKEKAKVTKTDDDELYTQEDLDRLLSEIEDD